MLIARVDVLVGRSFSSVFDRLALRFFFFRYKGDFFIYDSVVDWLETMRKISLSQQFLNRPGDKSTCKAEKEALSPEQEFKQKGRELTVCYEQLKALQEENALLRKKLENFEKGELSGKK